MKINKLEKIIVNWTPGIGGRIKILVTLTLFALCAIAGITWFQYIHTEQLLDKMLNKTLPATRELTELENNIKDMQLSGITYVHTSDANIGEKYLKIVTEKSLTTKSELNDQQKYIDDEKQKLILADLAELHNQLVDSINQSASFKRNGQADLALAEMESNAMEYKDEFLQTLKTLKIEKVRINDAAANSLITNMKRSLIVLGTLMTLLLALVIAAGTWLYKSTVPPVKSLEKAIRDMASTLNFTHRVPVISHDEIGSTIKSFNNLIETLEGSLIEMLGVIKQNEIASIEMHQSSVVLDAIAKNGSESSSEINQAIIQIQDQINSINSSTDDAGKISAQSSKDASENGLAIRNAIVQIQLLTKTVELTAERVYKLTESSNGISKVVEEIRKIAEQTNLLALNAAIEAARAGESGRGFAVVADEVRKLAERVSALTKSISTQIDDMEKSSTTSTGMINRVFEELDKTINLAKTAETAMQKIEANSESIIAMVHRIKQITSTSSDNSEKIVNQIRAVSGLLESSSTAAVHTRKSADSIIATSTKITQVVSRFSIGVGAKDIKVIGRGTVDLF